MSAPDPAGLPEEYVVPLDVSVLLLRALVYTRGLTTEQRERAWCWVEEHTAPHEEMGG